MLHFFNTFFWNKILNLQKSRKGETEFPYTPHPISSNINILHNHVFNWTPDYLDFTTFYTNVFCLFQDPS